MNRRLLLGSSFLALTLAGMVGCATEPDSLHESGDGLVAESHWTPTGLSATLSDATANVLVRFDYDRTTSTGTIAIDAQGYRTSFEVPATAPPLTLENGTQTVRTTWAGRDQLDDTQRLRCYWGLMSECGINYFWIDQNSYDICCEW